jgi:HSP20 family protein
MSIRSMFPGILTPSTQREPISSLRNEIDRVFESFSRGMPDLAWPNETTPRINVVRKEKHIEVTAEIPGVDMSDVDVLVDDDVLTIKGEKKAEKEDKTEERQIYECAYGSFSRSVRLPFEVDAKDVTASFKNGVLTIRVAIPETTPPKATKVEIKPE